MYVIACCLSLVAFDMIFLYLYILFVFYRMFHASEKKMTFAFEL